MTDEATTTLEQPYTPEAPYEPAFEEQTENGVVPDEMIDGEPEDDGHGVFVWEQGRKVTLSSLFSRGVPVEHAFIFGGKRLKGRGQLMGFEEDSLIVGRGLVAATRVVPTRDSDEKVTKVTIETHLAMKVIVPADSDEAMGMLAGVLERRGVYAGESGFAGTENR